MFFGGLITNADKGVLLTWTYVTAGNDYIPYMAITTDTSASVTNMPLPPNQFRNFRPVLQAQDGSFVGDMEVGDEGTPYMMAFDATGSIRWSVANERPHIATDDGGVIGKSGITYDQNGTATGQIGNLPTQSWTANVYQVGPVQQVAFTPSAYAFRYAAAQGGNPSGSGTYVQPYSAPQAGMYTLATANLKARPQCDALLAQFANMAHIPEAMLITQLQATANGARNYIYDGPSSKTWLDPVKFPGVASSGVTTVGQLFASLAPNSEGLSQFNGYAVWLGLDDWHSWYRGWFNSYLITSTGNVNYYGMGTVMHEILHKQAVGGGFSHGNMDAAIGAVGWPPLTRPHNEESDAIGKLCFGNLQ